MAQGNCHTLASETVAAADIYWAGFLGCGRNQLRSAQSLVLSHGPALAEYRGIYIQSFGRAPIISIPAPLLLELGSKLATITPWDLNGNVLWSDLLGSALEAIIGPAWIGYGDSGTLRSVKNKKLTRVLTSQDASMLDRLRRSVTTSEWEHGGSTLGNYPLVGAFVQGELVAVAGYQLWGRQIAHLSVVTHP